MATVNDLFIYASLPFLTTLLYLSQSSYLAFTRTVCGGSLFVTPLPFDLSDTVEPTRSRYSFHQVTILLLSEDTPASIALGVTGARKPSNHDKVAILWKALTTYPPSYHNLPEVLKRTVCGDID